MGFHSPSIRPGYFVGVSTWHRGTRVPLDSHDFQVATLTGEAVMWRYA